jgi:Fe-S-cluster containining protein
MTKDRQDLCLRCGQCCKRLELGESPDELKAAYQAWQETGKDNPRYPDIQIIYPMLEPIGVNAEDPEQPYLYRCKHLEYSDEDKLFTCRIHGKRPYLCEGFPFYERYGQSVREDGPASQYPGCGYN